MFRYGSDERRSLTAGVSVFVGVGTHRVILERFVLYHVRERTESRMECWFYAETSCTARTTPPTTGLHTAGFWFSFCRNPVDRIVPVTFRCFQTQIELEHNSGNVIKSRNRRSDWLKVKGHSWTVMNWPSCVVLLKKEPLITNID